MMRGTARADLHTLAYERRCWRCDRCRCLRRAFLPAAETVLARWWRFGVVVGVVP